MLSVSLGEVIMSEFQTKKVSYHCLFFCQKISQRETRVEELFL